MKIVAHAELPYQCMSVEIMYHFELTRILIHQQVKKKLTY